MTTIPPRDRNALPREAWTAAVPPAWPDARRPALSGDVLWVSAHRQGWVHAEGDVVVLLAFDARTGKPVGEARWTSNGKAVRTSAPTPAPDGGAIVTAYAEDGRLAVLKVDRYGRPTERADVGETCPLSGRPHKGGGEARGVYLGRPRDLGDGTLVGWAFGDGKGCLERYRSLSEPPVWAVAAIPHGVADPVVVVKQASEEDVRLAGLDRATGEARWLLPGLDLEVLGAHGGLIAVVDRAPRAEEIDRRMRDDPEMVDGNPLISAPVRIVGLDAATGTERWAVPVEGDVGSACVGEFGVIVSAAREDSSGSILHLGLDGSRLAGVSVPPPPEEEPDEPPPYPGVPRLIGVVRGAVLWQGPGGVGASDLLRPEVPAWTVDDPDVSTEPVVASVGEPLWATPPSAVATEGMVVVRAGSRLFAYETP